MMADYQTILDFTLPDLAQRMKGIGEPSYRAQQIWNWLYKQLVTDYQDMTNLPIELRSKLQSIMPLPKWDVIAEQHSSDEQTEKVLLSLDDSTTIETVLMRYEKRRTLCISTQAGCAMGCVFCATGQMGFIRQLSAGEIIGQVLYYARRLHQQGERVTNIVMMGMGEPLHNYDNTLKAIDILNDPEGYNLGARRITLSTVGLVPAIRQYAEEGHQSPLAISLHAVTDEERSRLIPVNKKWPITELIQAARYYIQKTGRRITFEWALINGENDSELHARRLGELLQGMLCHVNLIPLNPTRAYSGQPSSRERVDTFQRILEDYGVSSTVRVRRGIDIQAGCGQLRDRVVKEVSELGSAE